MRRSRAFSLLGRLAPVVASSALACGGGDDQDAACESACGGTTTAVFDLEADLTDPAHFFDVPYPFDLRLDADRHPILDGFPNPKSVTIVDGLRVAASEAKGFPVVPVVYFRTSAPLASLRADELISASTDAPILLVDIDESSPRRGELTPLIAKTLTADAYVPENVLAVAPRPGFVLRPNTAYAMVVTTRLRDAEDRPLAPSAFLSRLAKDDPRGEKESLAGLTFAPLWQVLEEKGIAAKQVAHATVFETGDVVADQFALSEKIVEKYDVQITNLALVSDPEVTELCILGGTALYPQFQVGTPPFNTEGLFRVGADGVPIEQRKETAPIKIVLPKQGMTVSGYPLILNIHGSGGFSIAMVRPVSDAGTPGPPLGPAFPYAHRGFAMAGSAMPLNPERLPGASETAYINVNNVAAMRDTFRQGQLELRMLLEALQKLQIDPALLAGCSGPTLPSGATHFKFDPEKILVTGQSMGGMYTNMIAAIEPRLRAAIPTGAGGHWTHFIFETPLQNGKFPALLALVLGTDSDELGFMHPVMGLGAAALEAADPIAYVPRIAQNPLPDHPVRPVYEPVAPQDSYFSTRTYDAIALAFGHRQAGTETWPTLQQALALRGLEGLLTFPVVDDLTSENGAKFTGVVVQFEPKGLNGEPADGHAIYSRRDDVKYQYGCFAESFIATGHARVPAPVEDFKAPCE